MSGTKRVPVTRTPIPQITPKAIELFRQYRRSYGKRSDDLHYALMGRAWLQTMGVAMLRGSARRREPLPARHASARDMATQSPCTRDVEAVGRCVA